MPATIQTTQTPKRARALDTSGNNNHGQIYSGRALEFDGVTDYLDAGDVVDMGTDSLTLAVWAKGNTSSVHGSHLITKQANYNANALGYGLYWRHSENRVVFNVGDASDGVRMTDDLKANSWYRFVGTYNSSTGVGVLYVNGVQVDTATDTDVGNLDNSVNLKLGGSTIYFDGLMSDAQVWNTAWSAADATYDYLNPEQLALNRGGTSLTESNLKAWYPMQDGHRGQQSFILDGSNVGLGEELVTNGTMEADDNWTNQNSPTTNIQSSEQANGGSYSRKFISDGTGDGIKSDTFSVTAGVVYKVEASLYIVAGGAAGGILLRLQDGNGDDVGASYHEDTTGSWQKATFYTTVSNSGPSSYFKVYQNGSGTTTAYLDDVSVKSVNAKNHATTVFYGDELTTTASPASITEVGQNTEGTTISMYTDATNATTSSVTSPSPHNGSNMIKMLTDASGGAASTRKSTHAAISVVAGRTYYFSGYSKADSTDSDGHGFGIYDVQNTSDLYTNNLGGHITDWTQSTTTITIPSGCTSVEIRLQGLTGGSKIGYYDSIVFKEVGTATGWTDADQQLDIPQTALQSYNQLAWFDGVSGGDATLDSTINTGSNNWSFSFWLYYVDQEDNQSVVIGSTDERFLTVWDANHVLNYRENDDDYHALCANDIIKEGVWTHIVVTATADTSMTAYINGGVQTTNSSMSDTELLVDRFMEGFTAGSDYGTAGSITEISYYNDILTLAEIQDLFNDGKAKSALEASGSGGLVGYWRNNGLAQWDDLAVGGSNNGTITATETLLIPAGVDSSRDNQGFLMNRQKDTNALNIPNDDVSYVEVLDSDTIDIATGSFSIDFWIKSTTTTSSVLLMKGADTRYAARLNAGANKVSFDIDDNSANASFVSVTSANTGEWVHVAMVSSRPAHSIYINGALTPDATNSTDVTGSLVTTENLRIGMSPASENPFDGTIDDVKLYTKALTAAEVKRNYNAGKRSHR